MDNEMSLVKQISQIGNFIRALRIQLRFGDFSRAPLELVRIEVRGEVAECEWISRPADEWDVEIPRNISEANSSAQALQDAMTVRELLFSVVPGIKSALVKVFRKSVSGELELIIKGTLTGEPEATPDVASVAMRAKLLGFQFWQQDGILEALRSEECVMNF
jgi:hypothetical protein